MINLNDNNPVKDFADCLVSWVTPAYRYNRFGVRHPPPVNRAKRRERGPIPVRTTTSRRLVQAAATVAAAATLVTACSSGGSKSNSNSASSSSNGSSASSAGPTGSVIKFGVIGSNTGSQASSCDQGATVGPAWADWMNANGGLNGHKVQVISVDDGGDPAKAQAAEKQLVDSDQVLAIVVACDNLIAAYSSDATAKHVALVSGVANQTDWYTKPGTFVTPTTVASGLIDQMMVAKQYAHAKKFANLYCQEVAACGQAVALQKPSAAKVGIGYTSLAVSSTATSYTAQCLQLQQQGVDYAQLNFTTAAAGKFVQDCQAQNYNPTWGTSEQAAGKDLLSLSNFHAFGPAYAFPSTKDGAVFQTFRDAMGKYAKGNDWKEGSGSFAWAGFETLHTALANVGASPTRQDVLTALGTIQSSDLNGLLPNKVSLSATKPAGYFSSPCSFVLEIQGGKLTSPSGTVCGSPS
jgi:branched-chain amino acid transport system substrate-binding protein